MVFFYSKYEIQKLSYLISKTICSTSKTLKRVDVIIYIWPSDLGYEACSYASGKPKLLILKT